MTVADFAADLGSEIGRLQDRLVRGRLGKLALDPPVRRLFELWIAGEIYDGERISPLEKGVPQGSVVSPMLANLFLDELDESLALFGQAVVRYADDLLVLCKSRE